MAKKYQAGFVAGAQTTLRLARRTQTDRAPNQGMADIRLAFNRPTGELSWYDPKMTSWRGERPRLQALNRNRHKCGAGKR
ncbi:MULTISPECIES: hypothetical protein [Paraburkholderia]|uniref:Uncharacterized protein n=1 Tax=Paraburkholderia dioscoreae TaxID=2604047 RepID=A0A5Q4ZIL4_9BURK|nr:MULTISPECIES: hypothetical protein [Paraburkholderia]VVD29906.1 protein of unknown function [Paraburkholderia dioscoreae]